MGLKEMLAAKKAAQEQAVKNEGVNNAKEESTTNAQIQAQSESGSGQGTPEIQASGSISASIPSNVQSESSIQKDKEVVRVQEQKSHNVATESLVDENGKPLSGFALIKRRKELAAQVASITPAQEEIKTEIKKEVVEAQKPIEEEKKEEKKEDTSLQDFNHQAYLDATPESKQAYTDLKARIDALNALSDLDLKTAMSDLKKSLMQNKSAVALMLPSDIGQMVIALRKMTGVELAKAEEKKTGKKQGKKEPTLTAEQLEDAFKEL